MTFSILIVNFITVTSDHMKTKHLFPVIVSLFFSCLLNAQEKKLAELLGYPKDSKLLIIHADDMGLSHSVDSAVIRAFENKAITSGSIMVPCPWAMEIESYLKDHPESDAGIHLTLTAEWRLYKWDGVSPSDQIPSLLDENGFFYPSVEEVGKHASAAEAEKEMNAQIQRVMAMGIKISHIDTHMGSVLAKPELVRIYLSLSDKYNLPVLFPRAYVSWLPPEAGQVYSKKIFLLDNLFMLEPSMISGKWIDPYRKAIENLKPGLNQIIVHVAVHNDEMKAISAGHDDYGSTWRQKDLDMLLSKGFADLLKENNVKLITWGQIRDVMNK